MDPIFEAYKNTSATAAANLEAMKGVYRNIQKFAIDTAKNFGLRNMGIYYDTGNTKSSDLKKTGDAYVKYVGQGGFGVAIIEDQDNGVVQIIGVIGYSDKYNAQQFYMKVNKLDDVEKALTKWISSVKPRPSAAEVNAEMARFRNGRL